VNEAKIFWGLSLVLALGFDSSSSSLALEALRRVVIRMRLWPQSISIKRHGIFIRRIFVIPISTFPWRALGQNGWPVFKRMLGGYRPPANLIRGVDISAIAMIQGAEV
jgi:hypothetical protein